MSHKPYHLHKRPTKIAHKSIYYANFYDDSGRRLSAISTGETSKAAAVNWAVNYLRSGKLELKKNITFQEFSKNWWIPGKCSYIRDKIAKGYSLTMSYIDTSRKYVEKYLIPFIGSKKLTSIARNEIIEWRFRLVDELKLSSSSINRISATLKIMLKEAYKRDLILKNPAEDIGIFKENTKKKNYLTNDEIQLLFSKENFETIWENNLKHYVLNLLVASTGLRLGEAVAIKIKNIKKDYIEINKSWAGKYGMKDTKTKSVRKVPISSKLKELIDFLIIDLDLTEEDQFLFYGVDKYTPMDRTSVLDKFYRVLERIGISKDERKERNITFHSWRHFFNSICRSMGIADPIIQSVTGHKTQLMTEHYTSFNFESFKPVVEMQESIIKEIL